MEKHIKAIETVYKGYRFRSRLEARWAVFFDHMNIKWEYEFEGFELRNDIWYLPDFWLPEFGYKGTWCEVKPDNGDCTKAIMFAKETKQRIWLCKGIPRFAIYKFFEIYENYDNKEKRVVIECGIPNYSSAMGENRMYFNPCEYSDYCGKRCGSEEPIDMSPTWCYDDCKHILNAVVAAKQERFGA